MENGPVTSPPRKPSDGNTRNRSVPARGELLRSLRVRQGWTQQQAAESADVSDRLIRKAESGGPLDLATVEKLAKLYQTPVEAITSAPCPEDRAPPTEGSLATSPMTAKAKRFMEENWNDGRLDVIDELLHPEFKFHHESGTVHNRAEMRDRILKFRESFGVSNFVVEEATDHGDFVALRWRCLLTHSGPWLDLLPTHRRVVVHGSSWVQVVDGRFADAWDFWDPGLLYQQLAAPDGDPQSIAPML
jgi:transcriptional regulator with XRE-family HTH domain